MIKHAFRSQILSFNGQTAYLETDGLVLIDHSGIIQAVGHFQTVTQQSIEPLTPNEQARITALIRHLPERIIAPGFIDCHVHYPQIDVIGSPAEGLLPWLENYTFPQESKFSNPEHAQAVASFFFKELLSNGVTTALTFSTSHKESVNAAFTEAERLGLRFITGKCLMDRNCPPGVSDSVGGSPDQSLQETEALIKQWHQKNGTRLGYAITPRFAPSCTAEQLSGAGQIARDNPTVWIQSHVAENLDEIAWARQLFPQSRSYLSVYNDFNLMRKRAVYAHCIHLDEQDQRLLRESQTSAAVCPTSNLFLGSGSFDFAAADNAQFEYGFACDVGGGTSLSPFKTMLAGYYIGRTKAHTISPEQLWYRHTLGAAKALDLHAKVGNIAVGMEADLIVINPAATPLLARRTHAAQSLDELLFAMIVLGDDRLIEQTWIASQNA